MRTTVTLDDELLRKASEAMGTTERSALPPEGHSMPMIWFSTAHACAKVASANLPWA